MQNVTRQEEGLPGQVWRPVQAWSFTEAQRGDGHKNYRQTVDHMQDLANRSEKMVEEDKYPRKLTKGSKYTSSAGAGRTSSSTPLGSSWAMSSSEGLRCMLEAPVGGREAGRRPAHHSRHVRFDHRCPELQAQEDRLKKRARLDLLQLESETSYMGEATAIPSNALRNDLLMGRSRQGRGCRGPDQPLPQVCVAGVPTQLRDAGVGIRGRVSRVIGILLESRTYP